MTAQMDDGFLYRGLSYGIAGVNGTGLFDPAQHGLRPAMVMSACWRGYLCAYTLAGDRLRLTQLSVFLDGQDRQDALDGRGTLVFGEPPQPPPPRPGKRPGSCFRYPLADVAIPFTGGLLIARDFVKELYVHMGFHPAWKYRDIHELTFDAGRLTAAVDRSAAADERRRELARRQSRPDLPTDPADSQAVYQWIGRAFDQSYDRL